MNFLKYILSPFYYALKTALLCGCISIITAMLQTYSIFVITGSIMALPIHMILMAWHVWNNNFNFSVKNGVWQYAYDDLINDNNVAEINSKISVLEKIIATLKIPFHALELCSETIVSESTFLAKNIFYMCAFYATAIFDVGYNIYQNLFVSNKEHTTSIGNDSDSRREHLELLKLRHNIRNYIQYNIDFPNIYSKDNIVQPLTYSNWYNPVQMFKNIYSSRDNFLIFRSVSGMVQATYNYHYADKKYNDYRIVAKIQKAFDKIKSVFIFLHSLSVFASPDKGNQIELANVFEKMRTCDKQHESLSENNKPVCAYFVSSDGDESGAVINSKNTLYYHLYKISLLEQNYNVHPYVVKDVPEMQAKMQELKNIKLVDIVAHGSVCNFKDIDSAMSFMLNPEQANKLVLNRNYSIGLGLKGAIGESIKFSNLAGNASVILDACSVGTGDDSYAEKIAVDNPGVTIYAPGHNLFFSHPVVKKVDGVPHVAAVNHGLCLAIPYQMRCFKAKKIS